MAVERRERILAMINARGLVSLKELEYTFPEVSSMTLRRDLQYLDERGEVLRVRRGARAVRMQVTGEIEPVYAMRAVDNLQAKEAIAQAALPLIESGKTIFIDAGTTSMRLARRMQDAVYSVVTHAPNIALEIAKHQYPEVFVLGGRILKGSLANTGHTAISMLEQFNIDLAIVCPAGYVSGVGFTCGNQEECELKRKLIERARRTVVMMDQSKIERSLPLKFAGLRDIDMMITEGPVKSDATQRMIDEMRELNIEVRFGVREVAR